MEKEAPLLASAYFDGATYDPVLDQDRLNTQLYRVFRLMRDETWRTLSEIAEAVDGSEAAVSARLRDFRKDRFGSHQVDRRRRGDGSRGCFEYRLVLRTDDDMELLSRPVPNVPSGDAAQSAGRSSNSR